MSTELRAESFLAAAGAGAMPHSGRTLLDHLRGTAALLRRWGCGEDVVLAGLAHSVYGTDQFTSALVPRSERSSVRDVLGDRPEHLVYLFCTLERSSLFAAAQHGDESMNDASGARLRVDAGDLEALCYLAAANVLEQAPAETPLPASYGYLLSRLAGIARQELADRLRRPPQAALLHRYVGDVERFASEVWGRHAHVHRSPEPVDRLLTVEVVEQLIGTGAVRLGDFQMVRDGRPVPPSRYLPPGPTHGVTGDDRNASRGRVVQRLLDGRPDPRRITASIHNGAVMVVQGAHRYHPPLADLATGIEHELGHPCHVDAHITPPTEGDPSPRSDSYDALVIQTRGTTVWQIQASPWESRNVVDATGRELTLHAGDVLYLPLGTPHSTRAVSELSIHLTVAVTPYRWRDVLLRCFADSLGPDDARLDAAWLSDPDRFDAQLRERWRNALASGDDRGPAEGWTGHPHWARGMTVNAHFSLLRPLSPPAASVPASRAASAARTSGYPDDERGDHVD